MSPSENSKKPDVPPGVAKQREHNARVKAIRAKRDPKNALRTKPGLKPK